MVVDLLVDTREDGSGGMRYITFIMKLRRCSPNMEPDVNEDLY